MQSSSNTVSTMPDLVSQPTAVPTRKTAAVIIGGSASTAASVVLGWALAKMGWEVPAEVQVAMVSLALSAVAYFTRERQETTP